MFGDAQVVAFKVVGAIGLVVVLGVALFVLDWRREAAEAEDLRTLAAQSTTSGGGGGSPSLWVNAGPIGSTVRVDGDSVGTTPLWLSTVGLGRRHVQVFDRGTVLVDTTVEMESGVMVEVDRVSAPSTDAPEPPPTEVADAGPTPAPAPAPSPAPLPPPTPTVRQIQTGDLRVTSAPAGAAVVLDGRRIGTTPLAVSGLVVGRHTITLSKPGFENAVRRVDVRAGTEYAADISLRARAAPEAPAPAEPQVGTVEVLIRPWGTVSIDGAVRQRETDVIYRTQLSAGPHRIRAAHPTLGSVEREVVVAPGSTARIEFDLSESGS